MNTTIQIDENRVEVVNEHTRRAAIILLVDAGVVTSEEVKAAEERLEGDTDE